MANSGVKSSGNSKRGISLFNIKVGGIDLTFLILVLLILTIGLIMMFSASYASAYYREGDSLYYITRQVSFAVVGVIGMLMVSTIDYRILSKFAWPIMFLSIVLLIVVLFSAPINNAKRWINLGFTNFQPSEIAKFAVVILFAHLATELNERMHTFRYGIVPFVTVLAVIAGLMILQPHLSGTLIILAIGAVMMIIGGADLKWFAIAAIAGVAVLLVMLMIPQVVSYAASRLEFWLDPFSDPKGKGFQTIQSLLAVGSGGFMGVGIGNSRQKFLYLPEPQNDFVFAIVCEELGFVGATFIIILFALMIWRGFIIGMRCKEKFGALVAVGLTSQVGLQTVLNIMVVTNTVPNTGISLPFFSYGGTALIMLLLQMGVVLSISRETTLEKT